MISGRVTITFANKPVRLWPVSLDRLPRVEADVLPSNAADEAIYIGGPETSAGEDGEMGRPLWQRDRGGDSWAWDNIDPFNVWIAGPAGAGVSFLLYGVGDE
jgi:hypothetical protein